jgi:autotransporter-associated beta strand protein
MKISNQDFLSNNFNFTNNQIASLQNEGNLEAQYVALIAPQVLNKGTITTNVATMIAAGDDVKLSISDSNRLSVNINPAKIKTLSSNEGVIKSENGTVSIQANAAQELVDQTINAPRSADSLISENGVIKLVSSGGSIKSKKVNLSAGPLGGTEVSGTIDASSTAKGGDIEITGKEIQVKSNSTLLATGETGGGNILVGGDWQGSNGVLQATYTTVEKDTLIDASSKGIGDGGKIVVWSDIHNANSKTVAQGKLYAKANIGDGGKIETSGYALNIENVDPNTLSIYGKAGNYLIDPYNYSIYESDWTNINNALSSSDITITTDGTNYGNNYGRSDGSELSGRIEIYPGSRIYTGGRDATLTLTAANNVEIKADISTTSKKLNIIANTEDVFGTGDLDLRGGNFTVNTSATTSNTYSGVLSNLSLTKSGIGNFILSGTNTYSGATTVSAGTLSVTGTLGSGTYAGNIANSGTLAMGSSSNQTLSGVVSGTGALTKSGNGTLTLSGANTYSGATTISAGTLSASSLADTTALSVASGATYKLDQNDTVASIAGAGNINLQNRTLTSAGASDTNFSGIILGTGGLTIIGSNNLTLSGANTYSGTTHINGGGLILANSNALASNSIQSTSGRLKTTERISNLTVTGAVNLIGDIATTGAQTYSNNVTIGAGSAANPLTISSQNSDIAFSGTVKTGSGAKAAQRSLTVNAGTGNVTFND